MGASKWYTELGCPRPAGTYFRQRDIRAKANTWDSDTCLWVVSAVETLAGPVFECSPTSGARRFCLAEQRSNLSQSDDIEAKAWRLYNEDPEGWEYRVVEPCCVTGCWRGAPMWETRGCRAERHECVQCAARTVAACVVCAAPDSANYANREQLLTKQFCFSCDLWDRRLFEFDQRTEFVAGRGSLGVGFYSIAPDTSNKSCAGFGGHEWKVRFLADGREVTTRNLWYGGEIPAWWLGERRFQVTAEFTGGVS